MYVDNQKSDVLDELNLLLSNSDVLEKKSVEDISKIPLKAIEEIDETFRNDIESRLLTIQRIISDFPSEWKTVEKAIQAYFTLNPYHHSEPKIEDHYIKIEVNPVEDDLSERDWEEIIESTISALKSSYHPCITSEAIERFKKEMFEKDRFTYLNLRNALKANFAVGHLGTIRLAEKSYQISDKIRAKHPDKTAYSIEGYGYEGQVFAYLYNSNIVSNKDIKTHTTNYFKPSLKFLKSVNGNIPLIKLPSFNPREGSFAKEIKAIAKLLGRNYNNIILDLRENKGGNINDMYYFLSLFLGNHNPDIYPISINGKFHKENQSSLTIIEEDINSFPLGEFYEYVHFQHENVKIKKITSEKLMFEKLVVLIDDKTFSGGEISAACLKNTLGSKVCILGKPARGSFEVGGKQLKLSHEFLFLLPSEEIVFYSKKFRKLLTGQRLLPDIVHEDPDTILEKACEILNGNMSWIDIPSYEPMLKY